MDYHIYWLVIVPIVVFGAIYLACCKHPKSPTVYHLQRDRHDDTH